MRTGTLSHQPIFVLCYQSLKPVILSPVNIELWKIFMLSVKQLKKLPSSAFKHPNTT